MAPLPGRRSTPRWRPGCTAPGGRSCRGAERRGEHRSDTGTGRRRWLRSRPAIAALMAAAMHRARWRSGSGGTHPTGLAGPRRIAAARPFEATDLPEAAVARAGCGPPRGARPRLPPGLTSHRRELRVASPRRGGHNPAEAAYSVRGQAQAAVAAFRAGPGEPGLVCAGRRGAPSRVKLRRDFWCRTAPRVFARRAEPRTPAVGGRRLA